MGKENGKEKKEGMRKYGLPYKGSKSKMAERIIDLLPGGKTLYDLFAGGCAITHAALLSGKWERVVANDIGPYPILFRDAINGKYHEDYRWVSREDFFKSVDPFERLIFSFGNDCRTYIYSAGELEEQKKALHWAICYHDYEPMKRYGVDLSPIEDCKSMYDRRMKAYRIIAQCKKRFGASWCNTVHIESLERLERVESLERLERVESLERLERVQSLERLEVIQGNYYEVDIEEDGAVIYCDIPYRNTNGYGKHKVSDFDYERFYEWASCQSAPVFISEYWMPEDGFVPIRGIATKSKMNADKPTDSIEKLFVPRRQYEIGGGGANDSFVIEWNQGQR